MTAWRGEAHVITCERCGADAVDARGQCRNCGWQAPPEQHQSNDSSPSLGETRAADLPATPVRAPNPAPRASAVAASSAPYARGTRPVGGGLPPVPAVGGPSSRYCGTCGARIENGQSFCGQCGTPVDAATPYSGTEYNAAARSADAVRYQIGAVDEWGNGDALTEAIADVPPAHLASGFARSGLHSPASPYGAGYAAGAGAPPLETPTGSSRTLRVVLGVICLACSVASAVAAIVLALATFH